MAKDSPTNDGKRSRSLKRARDRGEVLKVTTNSDIVVAQRRRAAVPATKKRDSINGVAGDRPKAVVANTTLRQKSNPEARIVSRNTGGAGVRFRRTTKAYSTTASQASAPACVGDRAIDAALDIASSQQSLLAAVAA
jgi:hypothetical protein